jgi:leucine dehydrogenase
MSTFLFDALETTGCQNLFLCSEKQVGLKAIIAIHNTSLGPAAGGTRMRAYATEEDAVLDACRLARSMTYKSAAAGVAWGGGKCVILGDPAREKTEALFEALGQHIQRLNGRYIAGEDVGTTQRDLLVMRRQTPYVAVPAEGQTEGGALATAQGVLQGMRACLQEVYASSDLHGRAVAVQGLGTVGSHVVTLLSERGARVIVADVDQAKVDLVRAQHEVQVVQPEAIHTVPADVYCPCALGNVLTEQTIPQLRCAIVCGSANNQLAEERLGDVLAQDGILYAPDYIVNAGAVIFNYDLYHTGGRNPEQTREKIVQIAGTVEQVIALAREQQLSMQRAANLLVEQRLQQAHSTRSYPVV